MRHLVHRRAARLTLLATLALYARPSHAELVDTTGSLHPGELSFAIEAQAGLVRGTPFSLNLHEAVGLAGGLDLTLRQGYAFDGRDWYLGGGIKWSILSANRQRPGLALWLGGHYLVGGGLAGGDATFMADYPIGRFRPYLAIDTNLDFGDDVDLKLALVPGLRLTLHERIYFLVEGGIGLTGAPRPHHLSAALRITI